MHTDAALLSLAKIHSTGQLLAALRHNQRVSQRELGSRSHIDPARSLINRRLLGGESPEADMVAVRQALEAAGVGKLRKNAVLALEFLVSLHPDHQVDEPAYFEQATAWLLKRLGGIAIAADVHHDEAAPHCHLLILPLVAGRMVGSDLVSLPAWAATRRAYYAEVASRHGLREPPARLHGEPKDRAVKAVLSALQAQHDPLLESACWQAVRQAIERDPRPFAAALGIVLQGKPAQRQRTMAEIFTGTGKRTGEDRRNPIGDANPLREFAQAPTKETSLTCEGNFFQPTPNPRMALAQKAIDHALHRQATRPPPPAEWEPQVVTGDDGTCRIKDCPDPWAASNIH